MRSVLQCALLLGVVCGALCDQANPEASDITYILCTRSNRNGEDISYDDGSISSNFDSSRRTYVIVHGFSEDGSTSSWMETIKSELLDQEDANVIKVDWGTLSAAPRYDFAAPNTKFTGKDLAKLLDDLSSRGGLSGSNLHLIGFSLGAQVVGVAGNSFGGIDRITGLDPAKPLFENSPSSDKLDSGDASFVDVIHTNSGELVTGHLSFLESLGHVDFYPNGGHDQRGCPPLLGEVIINLANLTLDQIDACSHGRAPAYFITSLQRGDFIAYKCSGYDNYESGSCTSNTNNIGFGASSGNSGQFYVETLVDSPFVASQIKTDFAIDSSANGELVLLNTVSGYDEDEFDIFDGSVSSGSTVTKIITASSGGVTSNSIKLKYDGSGTLSISSINGEDIESGEKSCIGTNLSVDSGSEVSTSPSNGSC